VFQAELPLANARSRAVKNAVNDIKPGKSKLRTFSDLCSLIITVAAIIANIPIGTLISKIVCHEKRSIKYPPRVGPRDTEAEADIDQKPSATPRFSGGNSLVIIAMPTGIKIPAPAP
jgi:hypothetical protein